jgi:hypothetical protein
VVVEVVGPGLGDAIESVRSELERAVVAGKSSPVAFRAGPVELEFTVAFTSVEGVDAGVRVWVVSVGAKGEVSNAETHRVKVVLDPVDRVTGERVLVGDVGED